MEAFSADRRCFREVSQAGLPSPVSIRRRVGPWPTRYVFVPVERRFWLVLIAFLRWVGWLVVVLGYLGE